MVASLRAHPRIAVALLLVVVAGGLLRVDAAANRTPYQSVDEQAYARLARVLAQRLHYGHPDMREAVRWPPGAPAVFALAHKARPVLRGDGRYDVPSAYPVQAALSIATVLAAFALAAVLAGPLAGILTAGAVAFYPPLLRSPGQLLTEPLGAFLLPCALIAVILALRRRRPAPLLGAGLLLGLCVLVRGDLVALPFLLAVVGALLARRDGAPWSTSAAVAAALALGALIPMAPWSAFASSQAGRFVPVTSGGGSNLFVGTYLPGDGTIFGVKRELAHEAQRRFRRLRDERPANIRSQLVLDAVAARHPGSDRDSALRHEALENLRRYAWGDPLRYLGMSARKVARLWGGVTVGTHRTVRPAVLALHLTLLALSVVALTAALALRRRPELWLLVAVLVYVTAINVVFIAEARHNLPVMPVLLAAGAAGGVLLVRGPAAARGSRRRPAAPEPSAAGRTS